MNLWQYIYDSIYCNAFAWMIAIGLYEWGKKKELVHVKRWIYVSFSLRKTILKRMVGNASFVCLVTGRSTWKQYLEISYIKFKVQLIALQSSFGLVLTYEYFQVASYIIWSAILVLKQIEFVMMQVWSRRRQHYARCR